MRNNVAAALAGSIVDTIRLTEAASQWRRGNGGATVDHLIEETPIALVYNGISHAVMLATPSQIEDFAIGFSLTEGIVGSIGEVREIDVVSRHEGIEVQMVIATARMEALKQRRRSLAGRTGCGLCGIESLAQLARPVQPVESGGWLSPAGLDAATAALHAQQQLHRRTSAAHAAAFVRWSGALVEVREDVGRHNALDKLVGAMASAKIDSAEGFALITSRASYEMVQKTATFGIRLLAAMSAPTAMAVRTADAAGLTLIGFAGRPRMKVYAHQQRLGVGPL
jgi:FdhD protein